MKLHNSDAKCNPNWSDDQKLEYYTDFLMGIRYVEQRKAIENEVEQNPDCIEEFKKRDKKARAISLKAITEFDTKIRKHLEENYPSASGFEKLLKDH